MRQIAAIKSWTASGVTEKLLTFRKEKEGGKKKNTSSVWMTDGLLLDIIYTERLLCFLTSHTLSLTNKPLPFTHKTLKHPSSQTIHKMILIRSSTLYKSQHSPCLRKAPPPDGRTGEPREQQGSAGRQLLVTIIHVAIIDVSIRISRRELRRHL